MALTEAEKQQILQAKEEYERVAAQAGAANPEGKYGGDDKKRQAFEKRREELKTKESQLKAQYETLTSNPEASAYASSHPATQYELRQYSTGVTGYDPASQPDRARNRGDIDVRRDELIFSIAQSNPSYSINKISEEYQSRSSSLNPPNVEIDYEGTMAAREKGFNVGSGLTRNLPDTFQKEEDRRFGERNKIIELTESFGGPRPKTDYYVGLTEGGGKKTTQYTVGLEEGGAEAARSKEFAVSLSEGAPKKPRELSEAQVAKMSAREYAVYASEFAPYNEWVKQQNEKIRVEGLANWKEFKGDIKSDVADLKKQGVKYVTIKSDSGYETVPIDKAVSKIVRSKNVTSIAAVPEIPKGFTVAGSPQELVLVEEDKRKYAGPDPAYTGQFKDPRKGTAQGGLLEKAASAGAALYGETAKLGVTIMSGLVGASQSVKSFADEITGNATVTNQTIPVTPPADLEQAPVSQPLSSPLTTQTSSQKAVAAMGGMTPRERNVGALRQSLDQIVAASNRRDAKRFGEDPFVFAVKEQKKQAPLETVKDFGEGVGTGFFRASVLLTATAPQAVIDQIQTGDFSEKATQARFQKDEEDLRKLGVGPSVIGEALAGRGTGRSPAYNIGEAFGEVGTGFLVGGSPKAPKLAKPGVPMSGFTKARILTKLEAADNIYGVERVVSPKTPTGFVSKRFQLKPREKKTNQFIGSIGTEGRDAFKPLSTEASVSTAKVTQAKPSVAIGPKGEKITVKSTDIIEPTKGKPSDTPALIIDTDKGGLTGVVRAQPRETLENQMGIIVRGDVTPANMKRLGLKRISTDDKGVPVFAARLPKGAKKREKFLSTLSEAEELGFIKRVTDIDFIPTERALGIATGKVGQGEKVKGRKDIALGKRKESYGPRQLRNEFQTAPYYETTASMGTPRELRIKGTTEGVTIDEAFKTGKIPKGKPRLEDEFGLTGVDAGLKEAGLSPALKPKAEKGIKKFEDFVKPIEQGKGGAGRGGKLEPISQEKALNIAQNIKPLTQGVKTTEAPIRPEYGTAYTGTSSAYDFETEVTGKYSISPIGATEPRIDIRIRDVFDTKSNINLAQRDLIAEGSKQVQPTITQNLIRTDSITKSGLKEDEKLKNRLLDKLVFRNDAKQTPRTQTRLQTGQQLKQTPVQKQRIDQIPRIPFRPPPPRIPRPPKVPTIKIPEIEKRKSERKKKEKEKQDFFGNVQQENVAAAGYKKYDIRYGKRATREAALDLTKGRKGRQSFSENRSDSFLSKRDNTFTEKKPKKIGKDGFAKAGKKFSW